MNRDTTLSELRGTQVKMVLLSRQYDATKQLFDAACFARDGQEAQRVRDKLHAILDEVLDNVSSAMTLTRQLMELS